MRPRTRRAGPLWLWVLGLVLLIVVLWLLVDRVLGGTGDVDQVDAEQAAWVDVGAWEGDGR